MPRTLRKPWTSNLFRWLEGSGPGLMQGRRRDREGCFRDSAGNFLVVSCKLLSPPWKANVSPQPARLLVEKCLNINHLYLKSLIYSYLSENNSPVLSGKPVRQRDGGASLFWALPPSASACTWA